MAECNTTMVYIDSRDRNQVAYPNPASYVYNLNTPIRNAHTIEVMMFQMVRTDPTVNSSNASFRVVVGSSTFYCTMAYGEITQFQDMAQVMQNALRSSTNNNNWNVSTSTSGFISISFTTNFTLTISSLTSSLLGLQGISLAPDGSKLGYERGAGTVTSSGNAITGTKQMDIDGDPYILLHVNDYHPSVSANSFMETAFMVIPLENTTLNTRFLMSNDLKEKKNVYVLGPSQNRIDSLRISLTRPDGSLYETNGIDHQLVFRVKRKDGSNFLN